MKEQNLEEVHEKENVSSKQDTKYSIYIVDYNQENAGPVSLAVTECGHVFHCNCLFEWLIKSPTKTCPIDKKVLYEWNIITYLYLPVSFKSIDKVQVLRITIFIGSIT